MREKKYTGLARSPLLTVLLMSLHPDATPREKDRSRSLRRVAKIDGVRADGCCKIGGERGEGWPCKIGEERVDGLSHKIVGENDVEKIEIELVRNELMGSTEKGRIESQITAPWCGSRDAGWRVAAGKTTVLMGILSLLTSEEVFGSGGLDLECDGASIGNGDDSENWIPK